MFVEFKAKGNKAIGLSISILSTGIIVLNKLCAVQYAKNKKYAILYFDDSKGLSIGIKFTDKNRNNAFKVSELKNRCSRAITARSFLKHLKVDFSKSQRFIPEWHEEKEMLILKIY